MYLSHRLDSIVGWYPLVFLTRTLLIFRGQLVGVPAGRYARQTDLCVPEMRQGLHLEGEPTTSPEHRLRPATDVLLQTVRLQDQQKGHSVQAHETRALATPCLA